MIPVGSASSSAVIPSKQAASVWRRVLGNPIGIGSLIFLVVVVGCSVAAPLVAPCGPLSADFTDILALPSLHHLLGTDSLGRDVLRASADR